MSSTLRGTDEPLAELYDVGLLDLDGVVYVGPDAVPGAPAALQGAREHGMSLAFVTNNAARPPKAVAEHLTDLGIQAEADEVINSAQAAARYLAEHLPAGSRVLVLGTTGLHEAIAERGLEWTDKADDSLAAVVQGYSPEMNWALLAEGAVAINGGALWVATNVDPTVPSPRGPLPGNGSLVAAMKLATRQEPVVTGKPDPTMHRETLLRTGAEHPLVVGDRLDTDIEGANAVGCASLLVFSGVTTVADLLAAAVDLRPTYLAADVSGLLHPHPAPTSGDSRSTCGAWVATAREDGGLELSHSDDGSSPAAGGQPADGQAADARGAREDRLDDDSLDAVRALCAVRWDTGPDDGGDVRVEPAAGDDAAEEMVARLGLGAS